VRWLKRLRELWRRVNPWLERWLGPPVLVAGILLIAAGIAFAVVRLMSLALGHSLASPGAWPPSPPAPLPPAKKAKVVETPREAAEHRRGLWVLTLGVSALLVLVLAAVVVQTLVYDQRPADYFRPVGPRPAPGARLLLGYHWVDQNAGVVQIPIERAMDLLAQRGLPSRSAAESQAFRDHGQEGPSDSSGGRWP
jgi:hypothetical protein